MGFVTSYKHTDAGHEKPGGLHSEEEDAASGNEHSQVSKAAHPHPRTTQTQPRLPSG